MLSLLPSVREMYRPCPLACASVSRADQTRRLHAETIFHAIDHRSRGTNFVGFVRWRSFDIP
jgi:hypothetical protein